jgi:polygalacturonase
VHGDPFYVHDCYFNTGDDNIAAHADNTLVENCHFGTGHGASIGSLCGDWLTNITFRVCYPLSTPAPAAAAILI